MTPTTTAKTYITAPDIAGRRASFGRGGGQKGGSEQGRRRRGEEEEGCHSKLWFSLFLACSPAE